MNALCMHAMCMRVQFVLLLTASNIMCGEIISVQIRCICTGRLVTIDLFCLLIFTLSVTEIPLCKDNTHFPARFAPLPEDVEVFEPKPCDANTELV